MNLDVCSMLCGVLHLTADAFTEGTPTNSQCPFISELGELLQKAATILREARGEEEPAPIGALLVDGGLSRPERDLVMAYLYWKRYLLPPQQEDDA